MRLRIHYDPVGRRRWLEIGLLAIGRHITHGIDAICFGSTQWRKRP